MLQGRKVSVSISKQSKRGEGIRFFSSCVNALQPVDTFLLSCQPEVQFCWGLACSHQFATPLPSLH